MSDYSALLRVYYRLQKRVDRTLAVLGKQLAAPKLPQESEEYQRGYRHGVLDACQAAQKALK